jgi:hypothetical protein
MAPHKSIRIGELVLHAHPLAGERSHHNQEQCAEQNVHAESLELRFLAADERSNEEPGGQPGGGDPEDSDLDMPGSRDAIRQDVRDLHPVESVTFHAGTGLPLKSSLLGKMNKLEVHHIFPKAQLYKLKHKRPEVNALANFCFQTKQTNLEISDRLPEEYFPVFEVRHPGGLASQWIPADPKLWKLENYREFLEERRKLLAAETNRCMEDLLHGDVRWLAWAAKPAEAPVVLVGGITSEAERMWLPARNDIALRAPTTRF